MRSNLRLAHHRGTTAHISSIYPFAVQAPFGTNGVLMGLDLLAGGAEFCWDPFAAYGAGMATNANVWILGEPGNGKSALVKSLLWRMAAVYGLGPGGRQFAIADPKGEYVDLARLLGLDVVKLTPGGAVQINPLAPGPAARHEADERRVLRQAEMLVALVATVLDRPLSQLEDAALFAAVEHLATRPASEEPTLKDVAAVIRAPTQAMLDRLQSRVDDLAGELLVVSYALDKVLTRSLRGMFDGPSTVHPDWDGPGILIDLSAVPLDSEALPLVMAATAGWLQQLIARPGPQRVQVLDESWGLLGSRHTAGYLQSCFKLGRAYGVANICIAHRPSDLGAQADDGTATAKVAAGLLADSATKIILRQAADQLELAARSFGLTAPETEVIGQLAQGRSLWKIAGHTVLLDHLLTPAEMAICDTDQKMRPSDDLSDGNSGVGPG
jgi:type IV secretory pathway VirB4 component